MREGKKELAELKSDLNEINATMETVEEKIKKAMSDFEEKELVCTERMVWYMSAWKMICFLNRGVPCWGLVEKKPLVHLLQH
jgi:hypothetical protein